MRQGAPPATGSALNQQGVGKPTTVDLRRQLGFNALVADKIAESHSLSPFLTAYTVLLYTNAGAVTSVFCTAANIGYAGKISLQKSAFFLVLSHNLCYAYCVFLFRGRHL
jgi:hypothetical protein